MISKVTLFSILEPVLFYLFQFEWYNMDGNGSHIDKKTRTVEVYSSVFIHFGHYIISHMKGCALIS